MGTPGVTPNIVFPGHPLVIATIIMESFDSFADATTYPTDKNTYRCPAALSDERIPGAGGCVYSALDLLKCIDAGIWDAEETIIKADKLWADMDSNATRNPDKYQKGLAEAERYKERFRNGVEKWSTLR